MSQFMYLQRAENAPPLDGMTLRRVEPAPQALTLFTSRKAPVWSVQPEIGALDDLGNDARDEVRAGKDLCDTALGQLVLGAVRRGDTFCLFWASDLEDLDEPSSEDELFGMLAEELVTDPNWELYVACRGEGLFQESHEGTPNPA